MAPGHVEFYSHELPILDRLDMIELITVLFHLNRLSIRRMFGHDIIGPMSRSPRHVARDNFFFSFRLNEDKGGIVTDGDALT